MNFKNISVRIILSLILTFTFILPVSAADFSSAPDLEVGQTNPFVIQLQKLLNSNGYIINPTVGQPGSIGYETDYFGKMTQSALSKFQSTFGLSPTSGYFGSKTKAKIEELTNNGTLNKEVATAKANTLSAYGSDMCASVSQYGITWTFSTAVKCGQFVNGDWWVVGPVTVIDITPRPVETGYSLNGSMINPVPLPPNYSGFKPNGANPTQGLYRDPNNTGMTYDESKNVARNLPKTITAASSLVSTINNPDTYRVVNGVNVGEKVFFKEIAILTILTSVPPEGSFRPPYAGNDKTIKSIWNKSTLDNGGYSRLRSLRVPVASNMPTWSEIEAALQRPILEMVPGSINSNWKAAWGVPWPLGQKTDTHFRKTYGREIAHLAGTAGLMLNTDASNTQKERSLIYMIQWGIDMYGLVNNGAILENNGGHGSGRMLSIFIAAKVLGDSDMMSKVATRLFSETLGHFFVGNLAINTPKNPHNPPFMPYTEAMRGMPEWTSGAGGEDPGNNWGDKSAAFWDGDDNGTKSFWGVPYRSSSGSSNMGQVTTILLMNGRSDLISISGGSASLWEAFLRYHTERFYPAYRSGVREGAKINGDNGMTAFVRDMYNAHVLNGTLPPITPDPEIPDPVTTFVPGNNVKTKAGTTWVNTTRSISTPIKSFGADATATILDGPQDAGGITWYRVRYSDGTEGYTGADRLLFVSTGTTPSNPTNPSLVSPTITEVNGVNTNITGTTSTISPAFPSNTNTVRIEWEDKNSNYLVRYKKTGGSEVQFNTYTREYLEIENINPGDTYTFWVHTGVLQQGQWSEPKSEVVFSIAQAGEVSTDDDSDGVTNTNDKCASTPSSLRSLVNSKGCIKPKMDTFTIKKNIDNDDLSAVSNFEIGKTNVGKIKFTQDLNLSGTSQIDLDTLILIEDKKVRVRSDLAPQLNKPAIITLYNITKAPRGIKKNGVEQAGLSFNYDATAQTLTFTVSEFSEYELILDDEQTGINPPTITSPTNGSTIASASTATVTWTGDTSNYLVRVQNLTNPSKNTKNGNQNQEYENTWTSKSITFDADPGNEYKVWVHAGTLGDGTYSVKDEIVFTVGTAPSTEGSDGGTSSGNTGGNSGGGGGGGGGGGSSKTTKKTSTSTTALQALCTVDQTTLGIGSTASIDTTIRNGSSPYTLKWTGSMTKLKGFDKTKEDQRITFPKKGTYSLILEVKDKTGKKTKVTCKSVKVDAKYKTIATAPKPTSSSSKNTSPSSSSFARDLTIGSRGADVKELQKYLNQKGFLISTSGDGSLGKETDYFGPATASALARYQVSRKISPATGFFGEVTRGMVRGGK